MFDTQHVLPRLLENHERVETCYKEHFSEIRERFEEGRIYPEIFLLRRLYQKTFGALKKQASAELLFDHEERFPISSISELSAMFDTIDVDCLIDIEELDSLFSFIWFLFEETVQLLKLGGPLHNELVRNVHTTYRSRFIGGAYGFVYVSHYDLGFEPVQKLYSYHLSGKPHKESTIYRINLERVKFSLLPKDNKWSWFRLLPAKRISLVVYDIPVECSTEDTMTPFMSTWLLKDILTVAGYSFKSKHKP